MTFLKISHSNTGNCHNDQKDLYDCSNNHQQVLLQDPFNLHILHLLLLLCKTDLQ